MSTVPKTLTTAETHQILEALKTSESGEFNRWRNLRNYAMGVIMLDAGLRVGELVRLTINHLIFNSEAVKSLNLDDVTAEKKCIRIIPCSIRLQQAISACWCNFWSEFQNPPCSWAFFDKDLSQHISVRQVQRIIRKAAKSSIGREIHPHVFRHTFATNLMRITDIRVVQELLGHKHITSTQVYTHPNGDDKQKAIDVMGKMT